MVAITPYESAKKNRAPSIFGSAAFTLGKLLRIAQIGKMIAPKGRMVSAPATGLLEIAR